MGGNQLKATEEAHSRAQPRTREFWLPGRGSFYHTGLPSLLHISSLTSKKTKGRTRILWTIQLRKGIWLKVWQIGTSCLLFWNQNLMISWFKLFHLSQWTLQSVHFFSASGIRGKEYNGQRPSAGTYRDYLRLQAPDPEMPYVWCLSTSCIHSLGKPLDRVECVWLESRSATH